MISRRTAGVLTAVLLVASGAAAIARQSDAQSARVRIVSPTSDEYATGTVRIEADVQPAGVAENVVFSVDGAPVCTVTRPPYVCRWNAGASVLQHQIRVVANLRGGDRVVATVRTKKLDFAVSTDVDVVQVTATVSDGGHYVTNLPQSAFHVFEDGQPQTISHFESEHVPLNLIVAVDISSSMSIAMEKLKTSVKEFLKALPAEDRVALLAFNDKIFTLGTPASTPADMSKSIDTLSAFGYTSLYDVIERGADLSDQQTGRKAMIVFTDGEDEGSHARLQDIEQRLQSTDMTLYMIGQGRGTAFRNLKDIMTKLSEPTGGRAVFTDNIDQLHDAFADILNELSSQYLLGYTPTNSKRDGTVRTITLKVDGHHARARQGYRAPGGVEP